MRRTLALAGWLWLVLAGPALAAPTATLSATSGPPTTSLTVSGSGFDPSQQVDVFVDTTDAATAVSSATGTVSMAVKVPAGAQPGQHWITLTQTSTKSAAQASFTVLTSWPSPGFTPANRSYNPYENTITSSNVSGLVHAWSGGESVGVASTPVIAYHGLEYVGNSDGIVRAYSATGRLQWTYATGASLSGVTPVAIGSTVAFANAATGNVYGFAYSCRTDGGSCAPTWTTNVGSSIPGGGLTAYGNRIYVPSSDGSFHELNPSTGALITTLSGSGTILTPISFAPDGSYFWSYSTGGSTIWFEQEANGGSVYIGPSGTPSLTAVYNGAGYATLPNGVLEALSYSRSINPTTSGTGCTPAPAVANNVVYAGGCTSLGAYDPGTGSTLWNATTPGRVYGVTVAGDVVYACISEGLFSPQLVAYAASYGSKLWDGGSCSAAPAVVNGTVFAPYAGGIEAYTLNAAGTASVRHRHVSRPDPRRLRLSPRLHHRLHRGA